MKKKKTIKVVEYFVMERDKWGLLDVASGPHWSLSIAESLVEGYGRSNHLVASREVELEYFVEDDDE